MSPHHAGVGSAAPAVIAIEEIIGERRTIIPPDRPRRERGDIGR
jgi:hypothetical protein